MDKGERFNRYYVKIHYTSKRQHEATSIILYRTLQVNHILSCKAGATSTTYVYCDLQPINAALPTSKKHKPTRAQQRNVATKSKQRDATRVFFFVSLFRV